MQTHEITTREAWLDARKALLDEEKALTRASDALAAKRRALPWVEVEKDYVLEGPDGPVRLGDLFAGKRQLIVYHFMFSPDWEEGCRGCSFLSDHVDAALPHLSQKDVAYAAVSRAPLAKLEAFKARMGWRFRWLSSEKSDFTFDFGGSRRTETGVDELTATSVFYKDDDGRIYQTYSQSSRGGEGFLTTYALLDMVPLGREEAPGQNLGDWVKHHDRYEPQETAACVACATA